MGFSLTATNSKYSFSGGYGSFAALRANIAKAWDKEFGEHYDTLRACFVKATTTLLTRKQNEYCCRGGFKKAEEKPIQI